ncbi:MAG: LPXTG cell wall anchor domain-containing protein [Gemmataceae bacterium]|nr:LPXTG cell wall anchor domain-containing protein [Gemmataceae bacterium]
MDFLNTWPAMIGMFVAVVGLIGLLIFMRKKNKEE